MSFRIKRRIHVCTATHFASMVCLLQAVSSDIIVKTSTGPIQGVTSPSGVEAFLGVPYAEPPIGDLRFARTVPKKPWTETLNASTLPPHCPQVSFDVEYDFLPDLTNMSENCLYLNIWTPSFTSNETLKPVIIYIHFGGFYIGSSSVEAYKGENLSKRGDVVVVTFNYRLGPFGYFLAYIDEAPGNMGMYDQIMVMTWVKENAMLFGGDPENIVLMGVNTGAISVMAHLVSPISKSLFQKAIIQSGGITLNYFFDNNTRVFQSSERAASVTGCSNRTVTLKNAPRTVVDCLRSLTMESLLEAELRLLRSTPILFIPRTGDPFLPRAAIDYLREGKFRKDVPILTGFNTNEGTLLISMGAPEYFGVYGQNYVQTFTKKHAIAFARGYLSLAGLSDQTEIVNYYLSLINKGTSQEYMHMVANITGDYAVACNTLFPADFFSLRGNSVYFYKFGYRSHLTPNAEWMGATHMDEQQYIFANPINRNFTEEEEEVSTHLTRRWANFARTGDPNVPGYIPWLPYTYNMPLYLSIEQQGESIRMKPIDRCSVWRKALNSEIDSKLIKFLENLD